MLTHFPSNKLYPIIYIPLEKGISFNTFVCLFQFSSGSRFSMLKNRKVYIEVMT